MRALLAFLLVSIFPLAGSPIADLATQRVTIPVTPLLPLAGWPASCWIGFVNSESLISIEIEFVVFIGRSCNMEPTDALKNTWAAGIEDAWSRQFGEGDGNYRYAIVFDVEWVAPGTGSANANVGVFPGNHCHDIHEWWTQVCSGSNVVSAAHEAGHLILDSEGELYLARQSLR